MREFFDAFVLNPPFALKFRELRETHWWARFLDVFLKITFAYVLLDWVYGMLIETVAIYHLILAASVVIPLLSGLYLLVYRLITYVLVYIVYGSRFGIESPRRYAVDLNQAFRFFWILLSITTIGFFLILKS